MSSSCQSLPRHLGSHLCVAGIARCCESGFDDIALSFPIESLQSVDPLPHLHIGMHGDFLLAFRNQPIHDHCICLVSWIGTVGRVYEWDQILIRADPATMRRPLPYLSWDYFMVRD